MITAANGRLENSILLRETNPFVLVIENPQEYYRTTRAIIDVLNGDISDFSFWKGNTQIDAAKTGEIVSDIFSFDFADKKIVTLLHKKLVANYLDGDFLPEYNRITVETTMFLDRLCLTVDFALDSDEMTIEELLKVCSVKPAKTYDSLLEKIVCYVNILTELKHVAFFVFVGLKSVLTDEELKMLYKHCRMQKISLLLLESRDKCPRMEEETTLIVTQDLCEIVANYPEL